MATSGPLKGSSRPSKSPSAPHANDVIQAPDTTDIIKDTYDYFFIDGGGPDTIFHDLGITSANGSLGAFNHAVAYNISVNVNDTLLQQFNVTNNRTTGGDDGEEPLADVIVMAVTSVILGLMILITVIGNVFVIAAIIFERNLQNVANYLVASLAVADLMVACLVMPLGAVYEISKSWIMGPELCDMWTSSDVLCCTASILHLVAIAVDRYWAVTNVDYIHNRTGNRIFIMIFLVWFVAVIVSLAPQFGWKDPDYLDRINLQQRCLVSQDIAYQIFATCSTFYVPLFVILVLYWKIFQTARKRIHRRSKQEVQNTTQSNNNKTFLGKRKFIRITKYGKKKQSSAADVLATSLVMVEGNSTNTMNTVEDTDYQGSVTQKEDQTAFTITKSENEKKENEIQTEITTNESPEKSSTNNGSASHVSDTSQVEVKEAISVDVQVMKMKEKKESIEAKRERKAAKTLAIITGAFVVCWLPFFIMALLMPLCETCEINDYVASFFLWLGYFNSTLNPVIYTIFSPEFRQAFKRILFGAHRNKKYYRSGRL